MNWVGLLGGMRGSPTLPRINDVMLHSTSSLFFDGTKQSEELELGCQLL